MAGNNNTPYTLHKTAVQEWFSTVRHGYWFAVQTTINWSVLNHASLTVLERTNFAVPAQLNIVAVMVPIQELESI